MKPRYQDIVIELSKNIYEPGEIISGSVNLNFDHDVECDVIRACFFGGLQTKIVDSPTNASSSVYEYEKSFFNETIDLQVFKKRAYEMKRESIGDWVVPFADIKPSIAFQQADDRFYGFEAGSQRIPFSFRLPTAGLHTSFAARKCNTAIKYGIIIEVIKDHEVIYHNKADFSVVSPIPIAMGLHVTKDFKAKIDLSKGCHIDITLTLFKKAYLPTEMLECRITINNSWKHSIKYVHFNIYQKMTSIAKVKGGNLKKSFISRIEHAGVGLPRTTSKIPAGSEFTFTPEFYIPALIPFQNVENYFTVEYFAQVKVGRDASAVFGCCRAPISVGTHYAIPLKEEVLVDLSTPPDSPLPCRNPPFAPIMSFSATNPFVNDRYIVPAAY